jgi:hypothetical protein
MWERIENEDAPFLIFLTIIVILLYVAPRTYFLLSSKKTQKPTRTIASWAATAAVQLIRSLGRVVEGAAFAVELNFLNGRKKLPGLDVFSLIEYDN